MMSLAYIVLSVCALIWVGIAVYSLRKHPSSAQPYIKWPNRMHTKFLMTILLEMIAFSCVLYALFQYQWAANGYEYMKPYVFIAYSVMMDVGAYFQLYDRPKHDGY